METPSRVIDYVCKYHKEGRSPQEIYNLVLEAVGYNFGGAIRFFNFDESLRPHDLLSAIKKMTLEVCQEDLA